MGRDPEEDGPPNTKPAMVHEQIRQKIVELQIRQKIFELANCLYREKLGVAIGAAMATHIAADHRISPRGTIPAQPTTRFRQSARSYALQKGPPLSSGGKLNCFVGKMRQWGLRRLSEGPSRRSFSDAAAESYLQRH